MIINTGSKSGRSVVNRYIRPVAIGQGYDYVLHRRNETPYGVVPDRLVCYGPGFVQSKQVEVTAIDLTKEIQGQELPVFYEQAFLDVAQEMLGLVQSKAVFGIYRYHFLFSLATEMRFQAFADHEIGSSQYRPSALLLRNKDQVNYRQFKWRINEADSLKFVLAVKFGQVQPSTAQDLILYLAKYPFVAELV